MEIDWSIFVEYLPDLVAGAKVTLGITVLSLVIGTVVGLALALARISGWKILSWPAYAYIEFFRTTPPLVQIVWFYFVVPVIIGTELNSFQAASAALGLNIAAFLAEIFRSGIQGIDATQRDAARVLGLGFVDTYRFVVLPQGAANRAAADHHDRHAAAQGHLARLRHRHVGAHAGRATHLAGNLPPVRGADRGRGDLFHHHLAGGPRRTLARAPHAGWRVVRDGDGNPVSSPDPGAMTGKTIRLRSVSADVAR